MEVTLIGREDLDQCRLEPARHPVPSGSQTLQHSKSARDSKSSQAGVLLVIVQAVAPEMLHRW